jgi:glutathione S-transferase
MLQLCIGNTNCSSWSMRPWVVLPQAGIPFDGVTVRFYAFTPESSFKRTPTTTPPPTGTVLVLVDGDVVVWDTLAIVEQVAERHPDGNLCPGDRARVGAAVAEHDFPAFASSSLPLKGPRGAGVR